MNGENNIDTAEAKAPISDESLIYRIVGIYLNRKLKSKYQLEWGDELKNNSKKLDEYQKSKEKLARDAFLAIRSRTGQDFIDYFASTLCSVAQNMNEESYIRLTIALINDTDKVRTLTMLALSARS